MFRKTLLTIAALAMISVLPIAATAQDAPDTIGVGHTPVCETFTSFADLQYFYQHVGGAYDGRLSTRTLTTLVPKDHKIPQSITNSIEYDLVFIPEQEGVEFPVEAHAVACP
jgi:hypothetical protein